MRDILIFGEVLVDCFPDGQRVLGGAPFNVAWHLQALKQSPILLSRVGNDAEGRLIQQALHEWGMTTAYLQTDDQHPTGKVQVSFIDAEPHYQIMAEQAYDFISVSAHTCHASGLLYHGSLALRHVVSVQSLQTLLAQHTGEVFIDLNLRAPWWQKTQLEPYLQRADYLKLNETELQHWREAGETLPACLSRLQQSYDLRALIVTRSEQGAVVQTQAGDYFSVSATRTVSVVDTVGAGDAFSAVLLLGLQHGWSWFTILHFAQLFAEAIIEQRGAIVNDIEFYRAFQRDCPHLNSNQTAS